MFERLNERARQVVVLAQDEAPTGQIPFTARAKRVLELSLRESLTPRSRLHRDGTHLLGLLRVNEGAAARVLREFDPDAEAIRDEIIDMLTTAPMVWARLEAYRPSSPPLADDVVQELERLRNEIRSALDKDDIERATAAASLCTARVSCAANRACVANQARAGSDWTPRWRLHHSAGARRGSGTARPLRSSLVARDAPARLDPLRGGLHGRLADLGVTGHGLIGLVRCQAPVMS